MILWAGGHDVALEEFRRRELERDSGGGSQRLRTAAAYMMSPRASPGIRQGLHPSPLAWLHCMGEPVRKYTPIVANWRLGPPASRHTLMCGPAACASHLWEGERAYLCVSHLRGAHLLCPAGPADVSASLGS